MSMLILAMLVGNAQANITAFEPRFVNKREVMLEQHSSVQVAGFVTNIWPARLPYEKLEQILLQVDGCRLIQTEVKQVSCLGPSFLLSIYQGTDDVFWSEAYLDEQGSSHETPNLKLIANAVPVSVYMGNGYHVETWIQQDSIANLHQQALASAQGQGWQILLNDVYSGSFVVAKENSSEKVYIAGWQQEHGRIFVTRIFEK